MKHRAWLLAAAGFACCDAKAFNVNDDLLAFPQYEIVFSDKFISEVDAEASLAFESSSLSARARATSTESGVSTLELAPRTTESGDISEKSGDMRDGERPESFEYLVLDSQPYLCAIPRDVDQKNETAAAINKVEQEMEIARATDRGWDLLKGMEGHCMYFVSGWWSYSFCYNDEVKQFHALQPPRGIVPPFPPLEDQTVPSFVLGYFKQKAVPNKQVEGRPKAKKNSEQGPSTDLALIETNGDSRYLVQKLYGGSTCDITGRPRKIEVQFHCHPQSADRIGWIKETSTCSYKMIIYTPRLCNDVAFLSPKGTNTQQIVCREIVSQDGIDAWHNRKAAEARRKLISSVDSEAVPRAMVGNIEVGAMKQVGHGGSRIEIPGADPQGDQGEIVAMWSPWENNGKVRRLPNQELKKLDVSPGAVNTMIEEMQRRSPKRPWKLEIADQPGGVRELRGMVDYDDYDDEPPSGEEGSEEIYRDEL